MRTKKRRIVLAILFAALALSTLAWAVDCPIPDTGQTKCYDDTKEIPCPNPADPFYGQDTNYTPCNPHSYTKLDENDNPLPDSATEWVMVRDNVTGLIWEVKDSVDYTPDYNNPHDAENTYTWYDGDTGTPGDGTDTLDFINALNVIQFGGYDDWRLPTVNELSFIRNLNTYFPAIDTDYFPNTANNDYWSSTSAGFPPDGAWFVGFIQGNTNGFYTVANYVRAVRGGQCGSFGDFVDNGDWTVTDTSTGLMWEVKTDDGGSRDKDNTYDWQNALAYCENLSLAGYDDWRLPDANELLSIVDYSINNPIFTEYFLNMVSSDYWSSTSYFSHTTSAWGVEFRFGYMTGLLKSHNHYVLAVRGGQCGDPSTTTTVDSITSTTINGETTTTTTGELSTTTIGSCPCLTELIYTEDSKEVEVLRYFRDNILTQTPEGKELIKLYYQWSPAIVRAMEKDEAFKEEIKEMIDGVLGMIGGEAE